MPPVSQFMTLRPVAVERASTLAVARRVMNVQGVRHLPVVEDGRLVGLVTERDLDLLELATNVDLDTTCVDQAMAPDPLVATPNTALDDLVEVMADRKRDCAIIVGRRGIEGIFTAIDACQTLAAILRRHAA